MISDVWTRNPDTLRAAAAVSYILTAVKSEFLKMKYLQRIKMSVTCQQKSWPCNPDIHISYTQLNSYPDNRTQDRKVLLSKFYNLNSLCKYCFSPRPLQKVYEPIPVYSPDFNERYLGHKHRGLITVSKLLLFRIFLRKLSCDFSALPFTPLFIN